MAQKKLRILLAESSDGETAEALQALFAQPMTTSPSGRMSRQTLAGLGYRVLAACDGEEALRLCEHDTPALAILDVVMPKLGGLAASAALSERYPKLRVLFTSGYSSAGNGLREKDRGSTICKSPIARRRWHIWSGKSWTASRRWCPATEIGRGCRDEAHRGKNQLNLPVRTDSFLWSTNHGAGWAAANGCA